MKRITKIFVLALTMLFLAGCAKETTQNAEGFTYAQDTEMGEGTKEFTLEVTDLEGNKVTFTIHTEQTVVAQALLDLGLIEGEDGDYGLYIKKVNGVAADYDVDQTYWAFYIDGEYALTGADQTEITEGSVYAFKVEK